MDRAALLRNSLGDTFPLPFSLNFSRIKLTYGRPEPPGVSVWDVATKIDNSRILDTGKRFKLKDLLGNDDPVQVWFNVIGTDH